MSNKKLKKQIFMACEKTDVIFAAQNQDGLVDAEDDQIKEDELPTFTMLAYTGGLMDVGFGDPVGIDLQGLNLGNKKKPILLDHSTSKIVGHSIDAVVSTPELRLSGLISADNEYSENVVTLGRNGFPWQSSVGVRINKMRFIAEEEAQMLNGKEVMGPFYYVEQSVLNEVSFVALGADSNTESLVANQEEIEVEDNVSAVDVNAETEEVVDAATETTTEVDVNAETEETQNDSVVNLEASASQNLQGDTKMENETKDAIKAMRDEQVRIAAVVTATKNYPELQAKAIEEGMSVAEAKAAVLDVINAREGAEIGASYVNVGAGQKQDTETIEAAMCMQAGLKSTEKSFAEETLEAAHKMRNMPLRRMMELCAASEGVSIDASASVNDLVAAAYSTVSLPVILGNIANKSLLEGFQMGESVAALVAEKLTSKNFQTHTGVKLGGAGLMDKVNGGEVKSGSISEGSFTFKTNTVGRIIGLSRESIINDDLGAFTRLASALGMSAFKTRENDFWALVLANTGDFFGVDNANIMTTALSISAIAEAEAIMAAQTGIDETPANITADYLVCPSQLGATARAIYTATKAIGATALTPDANVFEGVYQPAVTPYLSNSAVNASASETGWYLMSKMQAPFGISYLNGNEAPVVEEVAPSAEYLGRCWRGYYDFGVCQIEKRGGVFSTGAGS